MKEAWKDIPGYEGLYQASTNGKIKSLPRKKWNGHQFITTKERILTPRTDKKGYACYVLYKSGVRKNFKGHYLILNTFIKNVSNKKQINHKDGIKSNNILSNLEYSTPSENIIHAYENNLIKNKKRKYKYNRQNPMICLDKYRSVAIEKAIQINSKPIYQYSLDSNIFIKKWDSVRDAERYYNKRIHIERGKSIGYVWKRKEM